MSEVTYFQEGNVLITNIRAVLGSTTYPIANITSVSMGSVPANRMPGIAAAVFGFLTIICSLGGGQSAIGGVVFGLIILGAGILVVVSQKEKYVVRIGSAGAERDGLTSIDQAYIQRIVSAMNQAIIRRG